jgi:hypothetical protein
MQLNDDRLSRRRALWQPGHRLASIEFAYSVSRSKMPAEQLAGFGALFVGRMA